MNGHPLIPTGVVPRVNRTLAEQTPAALPSRAEAAVAELLEMERKAKAWDAVVAYFDQCQPDGSGSTLAVRRILAEKLAAVKL